MSGVLADQILDPCSGRSLRHTVWERLCRTESDEGSPITRVVADSPRVIGMRLGQSDAHLLVVMPRLRERNWLTGNASVCGRNFKTEVDGKWFSKTTRPLLRFSF